MKTLYAFDRSTKYWLYSGEVKQKIDPISGEPIRYRYATEDEVLPEKSGYARGYVSGVWEYYVDNRVKEYWDEDGTKHIITKLGEEVPEGALFEAPVIPPTVTELAAAARAKRDAWLSAISWRYERHASELRLGIDVTDSIENLDTYAQTLRDITEQEGFPTTIDWPTEL